MAQVCDGTDWIGLGGGGTGGGGITTAGQDREIIYNDGGALTGNASLVFDKNTNSVGIGVAIPTQQLDVAGTMTSQGLLFKPIAGDPPIGGGGGGGGFGGSLGNLSDVDTTAQANGRVLTYNSTTSMWEAAPISGGTLAGGTSGYLGVWAGANSLGTSGTTATQHLFWDGTNHRLGIGTNTPWDSLSVNNNINLHDGGHKAIGLAGAYNPSGWQRQHSAPHQSVIGFNPVSGDLYFSIAASDNANMSAGQTVKMVVHANGNIGIGTSTPLARLHIDGTSGELFRISSSGFGELYAGTDVNHPWIGTRTNHNLRLAVNQATAMTLIPGGNVGIGTATPAQKLDVQGAIASHGQFFPWRWHTRSTGTLNFATTSWTDVPGASITFTLPANADVFIQFDGSVMARQSSVHCVLAFHLNGTLQGDATYGDVITMGSVSAGVDAAWWNAVSRSRWWSLSAGTHTIKIRGRSEPAGTGPDQCVISPAEYSRLTLSVIAYPTQ